MCAGAALGRVNSPRPAAAAVAKNVRRDRLAILCSSMARSGQRCGASIANAAVSCQDRGGGVSQLIRNVPLLLEHPAIRFVSSRCFNAQKIRFLCGLLYIERTGI